MNILSLIPFKWWFVLFAALSISAYIGWLRHVHARDLSTIRELQMKVDGLADANFNMAHDIRVQNDAIDSLRATARDYSERIEASNALTSSYKKRLEVALATLKNPPPEDPGGAMKWLADQNNALAREAK